MAGSVAMTGLTSGLDTDSIVSALVSSYSTKKDNLVKEKTRMEWTQDAWKDLNSKIYGFYSGKLSSMRFSNAFNVKKSTSSSTKATVNASSDAVIGTQKLKVKQLATSGYLTGGVVKRADAGDSSKISGSTKLSELGIKDGSSISIEVGGKKQDITIDENTTVNQLVSKLKGAGVNASFDENNQRFFISSKDSGSKGEFSLTGNNVEGMSALNALGLNASTAADVSKYKAQAAMTDEDITKLVDTAYAKKKKALYGLGDDKAMSKVKESLQTSLESALKLRESMEAEDKKIDNKLSALEDIKGATFEDREKKYEETASRITELSEKADAMTEEEKEELKTLQDKMEVYKLALNDTFSPEGYETELNETKAANAEKMAENESKITEYETALADDTGFENYINAENDKINKSNEELKESLQDFYETQRSNAKAFSDAYDLVNTDGVDKTSDAYKQALALVGTGNTDGTGAVRITGQDAVIELNGATFTSSTSSFQINGLNISVNALTEEDEEITLSTDTDVDGIYNMVKDFFKEYNELMTTLDKSYNAASSKGYEPLTDEEKEKMTDTEIEKWETKIKDSLLRRDSTLDGVMNSITSAMLKTYNINGKNYSLSSFGIKTKGYLNSSENDRYTYHIDGDKDDSTSSGNADKLRAAITADPEGISEFLNKLAQGVYDELSKKMKSTSLSSAYTVYNDKKMQNDQKDYKSKISEWEKRIEKYEEKYRKQFTAMETALSKLNSTTSSLTGLFSS